MYRCVVPLLLAGLLTAPPATADSPPHTRTLNWMGHWLHEDMREMLVREVAQEFAFAHQDVRVNLVFPSEIMGRRDKRLAGRYIADMIRTGEIEWDVIWLDDHIYKYVAEELGDPDWGARYLVDFTSIEGFAATQKSFIIDDPAYRDQTGGILVGPYIEGYYYLLWFNREVADRIGLQIRQRGMTFDDLVSYTERVAAYNREHGTRIATFYEAANWFTLEALFQQLVKTQFPDFATAIEERGSAEKRAAMLRALEAFERLGALDPLIASHATNQWFDTRHLVLEGEALFMLSGSFMYSHWSGIDKQKLPRMVPADLPALGPANHTIGGYLPSFAVLRDAPNRDLAIELLLWWSRPQVAERWVRYTKTPTGLRGNLASATLGEDMYERFNSHMRERYGSQVQYSATAGYLLGSECALVQPEVDAILRRVITGRATARQAYDQILELCP